MQRQAAWTLRVFELLADGPKPFGEVVEDAMAKVPREHALAQYRKMDEHNKKARAGEPRFETTEEHRIRVGSRQRVTSSIANAVSRGRLRSYDEGGTRYLALGRPNNYDKEQPVEKKNDGRAATWTKRAREILVERGPMRRRELVGLLWTLVPPGQAHRNAEHVRIGRGKGTRGAPERRVKERSDDELVEMGARDIVRRSLQPHVNFLVRKVEDEVWVALPSQKAELEAVGAEPAPALADSLREKIATPRENRVEERAGVQAAPVGVAPDTKLLRIAARLRAIANQVEEWQPFGGEPAQVAEELRQLATRTDKMAHEGASRPVANVQE